MSHRWFDCKMICFMGPLPRRYSLKMQEPHAVALSVCRGGGESKLIRADQQSCALPGVLGTTLGPEIDFSHSTSMMPKQSAWVMLRSPPPPLTPFGGSVLYPPPSMPLPPHLLKSAHLRSGCHSRARVRLPFVHSGSRRCPSSSSCLGCSR